MTELSHKIADGLYLVRQQVAKKAAPAKPVEVPTNHIAVIDCSGSMSYELPKIREQVKNRLASLIGEQDTFSMVWFSGRSEYGVLIDAEPIRTLKDLNNVHKAIDRWVRPVGLTGFKEPLEEVSRLVKRVSKKYPNSVSSLFFMSDGCDNCWPRGEILKVVEEASDTLASATFVEYGYYADRPLLTAMAEKAGGQLIFAQDFDKYAPQFEAVLQKRPTGAKRIEISVMGDCVGGFVFSMGAGELTTYAVDEDSAAVPEDTQEVWYLSPTCIGDKGEDLAQSSAKKAPLDAAYAALSLFSVRMQPKIVYPVLKALGDVTYIEQFSSCFGKQKYSEFMDATKAATFDPALRYAKGYDPNKVPRDDAFTVLDMLQLLAGDDNNRVLLDHEAFKYSPIGRGRVDASENLTAEELAQMDSLTEELKNAGKDTKKIKAINEKIAAITANKQPPLKFEATPAPDGYPISSLTFNEDRPNVSFLVRKEGVVDLSDRLPEQFKGTSLGKVPTKFPSFIFRNYAVVKDGLVNLSVLPVKLSDATRIKLTKLVQSENVPSAAVTIGSDGVTLLSLDVLPIINRKMLKAVSAKAIFEKEFELTYARSGQKVYNAFIKELFPGKKTESFDALYGAEAATWLKEQGFTDYSGFGPKVVQAEAKDFYMGKALEVKIKGYATIPSLNDFRKQATKGKFNGPGELMRPFVEEVEAFMASPAYLKASNKDAELEAYLRKQARDTTNQVRGLLFEMAQIKFAVIVGQVWFSEFSSIDENTMTLKVASNPKDPNSPQVEISGTVEMKELKITI